ncbi:hypothetical protein GCM10009804_72770 [Kribbella hippodromi]|uniref:Uncharacterized protein n=1 Tax=Kribbella hippodromi TaxID=434347 RepID=A0ABN2EFK6_9ACTN
MEALRGWRRLGSAGIGGAGRAVLGWVGPGRMGLGCVGAGWEVTGPALRDASLGVGPVCRLSLRLVVGAGVGPGIAAPVVR